MESLEGDVEVYREADRPRARRGLGADTLKMPIRSLMRTSPGIVKPTDVVQEAIEKMVVGHYGCVLVGQAGRLEGILSERDVVTRLAWKGLDPKREFVIDHMTPDPETLGPDDALGYALNIMAVGGFRHVPITTRGQRIVGILSIRDLQRLFMMHFRQEILTLPPLPPREGPAERYGG